MGTGQDRASRCHVVLVTNGRLRFLPPRFHDPWSLVPYDLLGERMIVYLLVNSVLYLDKWVPEFWLGPPSTTPRFRYELLAVGILRGL